MKTILINAIKGQAVTIGKELFGMVKSNTKVKVRTNAKEVFHNLMETVKNFKKALNKDSKQFKESIKESCKTFKDNVNEDSKQFKESVIEVVKQTEAEVELNDRKLILANKDGIQLNKALAKEYFTNIAAGVLNMAIEQGLSLLNNYANISNQRPELSVVA